MDKSVATSNISELKHGCHTCLVYESMDEYKYVATQFVKNGLLNNELVICILDEYPRNNFIQDIEEEGISTNNYIEEGLLVISSIRETYRGGASFIPDNAIEYWKNIISKNKDKNGIRGMGEATFALDGTLNTLKNLVEYEIKVNLNLMPIFTNHQYMCVYNKGLYPPNILSSIIQAHPCLIHKKDVLIPNPYYIDSKINLQYHTKNYDLLEDFNLLDHNVNINLEKNLRSDEEKFKYVLEGVGDGLWNYDLEKNIVTLNSNLLEMLNLKEADFGNTFESLKALIHPDDINSFEKILGDHLSEKTQFYKNEYRVKNSKGRWIWVEDTGRGLSKTENGQITRIIGTYRDITYKKEIELELNKLNSELENKVFLRTAQLEKLNKELEAFSYSVSHDLRAPLRHISGFLEMLEKSLENKLTKEESYYISVVSSSSKHMENLIDDLLSYAQTSQSRLHKIKLDLNQLTNEVIKILTPEYKYKKITWKISKLPNILGDPIMIKILFTNLISNAIKYSRNLPEIIVEIGLAENIDDINYVFYVKDYGAGFNMDYYSKLFGVFQRLHSQKEFEGNGIGLANCKKIVEKHGGKIWANSILDTETTFYFTLGKII